MAKKGREEETVPELERLRRRIADLEDALVREKEAGAALAMQHEETEKALQRYSSALEERVKELACLYSLSSLVERREMTLEQILQNTVEIIPSGWHYPEITCARIMHGEEEYRSAGFKVSAWGLTGVIEVHGEKAGLVEVYYREHRPDADEGPFLKEERVLIEAIAERLGQMIEHRSIEEALRESEERYRLIYDFTAEAIYTYDTELTLIGVNKKACEFIGYSEEELLGRNSLELGILHPDDVERTMADIQRLYQGEVVNDELRFIRRDGTVAIGDVTGAPLYDRNGKVIAFTNVARDITEAKKAEEALLESEDKFRGIVEQSSDGIVLVNREGVIVEWNRAQEEIVGIKRQEALGKFLWDVQFSLALEEMRTPQTYESLKGMIVDARGTGRAEWFGHAYENEIRRPDGQRRIIESVVFPIRTREGNMMGSIIRDITEAKRSEEELKRINRELDAYAYVVSHDLRGPISIVISASRALHEMLQKLSDDENARQIARAAEIIESSADASRRLVEDLLSLAQAGQSTEEVMEVDVGGVVRRVLQEKAGSIKDKGVRVILEDDLGRVTADPTHIYQLFSNLIGNALAYNDSPEPSITIGCEKVGDGLHRCWVWDNGPGIAPDELDKIFAPLFKGKEGGTGIGLAIVKKIVDVYGGEIRVYNDGGARFEFTLGDSST
jgi:PAS domain S-box-containing protein